ncbi:MAG: CtpF protein, partial [Rhodobiaceae bacterium]|nr:CtpF protein [Rhodobiaceae bacterium]
MQNLAFDINQGSDLSDGQLDPERAVPPVPRISVQAFCESPDIHAAVQDAFEDRRMSKTTRSAQMGGLAASVEFYQTSPTPNLIIVESQGSAETIAAGLEKLAEVCDSGTRVVVIGHLNDVLLYRELIRKGISEYLVAPISPLQLVGVVSDIYASPQSDPVGRVVAFAGARGGAGSSTIAHNV